MVVTQIVRRFGPVGGMERYVWRLTQGLLAQGVQVNVLCETVHGVWPEASEQLQVIQVPSAPPRPRWRAMQRFRDAVDAVLTAGGEARFGVIHSHERSMNHHITTIHGPLIGPAERFSWFQRLNRRLNAWAEMEVGELFGPNVRQVCTVSALMAQDLKTRYPNARFSDDVMWPGVDAQPVAQVAPPHQGDAFHPVNAAPACLFVGTEWKRKGLEKAVEIVRGLRAAGFGGATLTVCGPADSDVPRWISALPWVHVLGQVDPPYGCHDLLIHPALAEPFGMVIAEARAQGLPCVVSDRAGACGLGFQDLAVVELSAHLGAWVQVCQGLLRAERAGAEVLWSWDDLTERSLDLYRKVM